MDAIVQFFASIQPWQWIAAVVLGVLIGAFYLYSTRSNDTTRTHVRDE